MDEGHSIRRRGDFCADGGSLGSLEQWRHGPRGGCEKVQRGTLTTGQGQPTMEDGGAIRRTSKFISRRWGVVRRSSLIQDEEGL